MKRTKRIETDFDTPHPPLAVNTNSKVFFRSCAALYLTMSSEAAKNIKITSYCSLLSFVKEHKRQFVS